MAVAPSRVVRVATAPIAELNVTLGIRRALTPVPLAQRTVLRVVLVATKVEGLLLHGTGRMVGWRERFGERGDEVVGI